MNSIRTLLSAPITTSIVTKHGNLIRFPNQTTLSISSTPPSRIIIPATQNLTSESSLTDHHHPQIYPLDSHAIPQALIPELPTSLPPTSLPSKNEEEIMIPQIPNFSNVEISYSGYTSPQLIRSLAIFGSFSLFPSVAQKADKLYSMSKKILGSTTTDWLIEKTVFPQFCARDDPEEISDLISKLETRNVKVILNYSIEQDPETILQKSVSSSSTHDETEAIKEYICDEFIKSVRFAQQTGAPFIALKFSGMIDSNVLYSLSESINNLENIFSKIQSTSLGEVLEQTLTFADFCKYLESNENYSLNPDNVASFWNSFHTVFSSCSENLTASTPINFVDFMRCLNPCSPSTYGNTEVQNLLSFLKVSTMTPEENQELCSFLFRMNKISRVAEEGKVQILIDAEYSYLQPSIDYISLELQREWNKNIPLIWNTFQCYTKRSTLSALSSKKAAQSEGWHWAGKLVRGAYLEYENSRAKQMGYSSPLWENIEKTHNNFNFITNELIDSILPSNSKLSNEYNRVHVLVASHNQESLELVAEKVHQAFEEAKKDGNLNLVSHILNQLYFAQLYGMSDHLTYNMAHSGFTSLKYIAYGPVNQVMPFLIRRCQENSAMFARLTDDIKTMRQALIKRVVPTTSNHTE